MKLSILLVILIFALWPNQALAFWDDDTYVEYERSKTEWQSLLELECFVALNYGGVVVTADDDGNIAIADVCWESARQLKEKAKAWHREVETETITPMEAREHNYPIRIRGNVVHEVAEAEIGFDKYYIDQGKIWHSGYVINWKNGDGYRQ